jgi:hypothetical protein
VSGQRKRPPLGFEFAPVPRAALRALSDGALNADDLAVLAFLWDRAERATRTMVATLHQVREGVGWTRTDDALRKLLGRLERKGWLDYRTTPGQHGARYSFHLRPEPERSEDVPRSRGRRVPRSNQLGTRSPRGDASGAAAVRSEETGSLKDSAGPRNDPGALRSDSPTKPPAQRDRGVAEPDAFRGRQRDTEDCLGKGDPGPVSLTPGDQALGRGTSAREGVDSETDDDERLLALVAEPWNRERPDRPWADLAGRATSQNGGQPVVRVVRNPDGSLTWFDPDPPLEGEEAILADCQALVEAGIARWVEEVPPA